MTKNIIIQDRIAGKGKPMTCESDLLEDFISPYDSFIVERLNGLTDKYTYDYLKGHDEFGLDYPSEDLKEGDVYLIGSCRDIASQVDESYDLGIGVESKGDISLSAACLSLYGFTPTNGLISKYGVFQATNIFDNVGIISKDLETLEDLFKDLQGKDQRDSSSLAFEIDQELSIEDINIGLIGQIDPELFENNYNSEKLTNIDFDLISSIYLILSSVSFSTNTARFDGVRYGKRTNKYESLDELYMYTRGEFLSRESKLKILLGYYFLEEENRKEYYEKANNYLRIIRKDFDNYFKDYDFIISPVFREGDCFKELENYKNGKYTVIPAMLGYPSINIKINGQDLLIYSKEYEDKRLLLFAKEMIKYYG